MEREEAYKKGETPDYYTGKYKGIKAIDVIHDFELAHCKASALEYILRSGKKDDEVQDLRKAINHLQMQINFIEAGRLVLQAQQLAKDYNYSYDYAMEKILAAKDIKDAEEKN
jgi:hypothetical protein